MAEITILLCTIGSAGDVNPFIAMGQRLLKRGLRVVLVTSQYFESQAHDAGLEFIGLGSVDDYRTIIDNPDLWDANKGFRVFAETVVLPILEPAYKIISSFDPTKTIIVAQGQFFAAHIAHEKLGFPFITVHLQPAALRSVYEFPMLPGWIPAFAKHALFNLIDALVLDKLFAPKINDLRQKLGLPAVKKIFDRWMHSPQRNLCLFPDWFAQPQPDWPAQTKLTGFVYHDKRGDHENLPRALEDFLKAGSAPIVFTPGTAMKHADQFFLECIKACRLLGRRGILLTQHPEQLPRELPADIRHFDYLRGVHGHASKNIVSFNSRAGRPKPTLNSTSKQYVTTAKLHNARTFSNPFIGNRSKPNKSLICPWNGSTLVLRNANASRTSGVANNAARANRFFDVLFPTLGIGVTNVIFRLSQAFANR